MKKIGFINCKVYFRSYNLFAILFNVVHAVLEISLIAGSALTMVVGMIKPFMSDETRRKFDFCNTENIPEFMKTFLPTVPADMLCPRWGGIKKCSVDFCCPSKNGK